MRTDRKTAVCENIQHRSSSGTEARTLDQQPGAPCGALPIDLF